MTNATEYSEDPYQDGTVPADADFATSSADGASAETELFPDAPGTESPTGGDDDRAERHD